LFRAPEHNQFLGAAMGHKPIKTANNTFGATRSLNSALILTTKICRPSANIICGRPPSYTYLSSALHDPNSNSNRDLWFFLHWKLALRLLLPWGTFAPICLFLCLLVLPVINPYGTDRQTDGRTHERSDGQDAYCGSLGQPHNKTMCNNLPSIILVSMLLLVMMPVVEALAQWCRRSSY